MMKFAYICFCLEISGMKKAIIVGATSGIGREVAKLLIAKGWTIGVCGRREDKLLELQRQDAAHIFIQALDVTCADAPEKLRTLMGAMGGVDLYLHVSGIGFQNKELDLEKELKTVETNAKGFTRMVCTMFRYFEENPLRKGHIACVSSIAGTKGLGVSPSYSATKRYCNTYMEALEQLAHIKGLPITFTDIRPGFVDTDLLKGDYKYPMLMRPERVAQAMVRGIERKKRVVTIDWKYKLLVFFWRWIPKCIWVKMKIQ